MLGRFIYLFIRPFLTYRNLPDINDANSDLISNRDAPVRKKAKHFEPIRVAGRRSISNLLELLDSRVRPGLTGDEFGHLFVRCECGLILTRRAFRGHGCSKEVIDLTGEDTDPAGDD
jgi:hypothetical protein